NQTNSFENGIYTVTQVGDGSTPAIYTRATDYDEPSDIDPGDFVLCSEGINNAGTGWVETAIVNTIGTDPITFLAFGGINKISTVNVQSFSSSSFYTPTPGMKYCIIECCGSGAGGGGTFTSNNPGISCGGGGGSGGYSR